MNRTRENPMTLANRSAVARLGDLAKVLIERKRKGDFRIVVKRTNASEKMEVRGE